MKNENVCPCCGEMIHPHISDAKWAVVTAQTEDGHARNMYFISSKEDEIRKFASAVNPKMIYSSYYPSLKEAVEFAEQYLVGYDEIDPVACH